MVSKIRSVRIDDELWEELEKVAQRLKIDKTSIIKMALIEKIQRMQRDWNEDTGIDDE